MEAHVHQFESQLEARTEEVALASATSESEVDSNGEGRYLVFERVPADKIKDRIAEGKLDRDAEVLVLVEQRDGRDPVDAMCGLARDLDVECIDLAALAERFCHRYTPQRRITWG